MTRREVRAGPAQDATRASSNDDIGDDVVMREDDANGNRAEHPSSSGSDSRRRITTNWELRDVRDEQTSITEQRDPRRSLGKTTVPLTTQVALDGYHEKAMRIAIVERNTFNWVSSSSAELAVGA